jgi:hypothetical protein
VKLIIPNSQLVPYIYDRSTQPRKELAVPFPAVLWEMVLHLTLDCHTTGLQNPDLSGTQVRGYLH